MLSTKTAYRCDLHGINTCPLTPSALTYSDVPCCASAMPLVTLHSDVIDTTGIGSEGEIGCEPADGEPPVPVATG